MAAPKRSGPASRSKVGGQRVGEQAHTHTWDGLKIVAEAPKGAARVQPRGTLNTRTHTQTNRQEPTKLLAKEGRPRHPKPAPIEEASMPKARAGLKHPPGSTAISRRILLGTVRE